MNHLPNLKLEMLWSMRFATNFLMIDWHIRVRRTLEQMVKHHDWTAYVNKLSQESDDQSRSAFQVCEIKTNVNDKNTWTSCNNYYHILEEVLKEIRVFDGPKLVMRKVWLTK